MSTSLNLSELLLLRPQQSKTDVVVMAGLFLFINLVSAIVIVQYIYMILSTNVY